MATVWQNEIGHFGLFLIYLLLILMSLLDAAESLEDGWASALDFQRDNASLAYSADFVNNIHPHNDTLNATSRKRNMDQANQAVACTVNTLGIGAIVLNIGFLLVMCHTRDASMPYHRFMKGLSIADILASFAFLISVNFSNAPQAIFTLSQDTFVGKHGLNYVFRAFPWVFFTGYFLTLTCLSVNQYIAVCRPWKYSNLASPKMVYLCLLMVWLISSLQVIIPVIVTIILDNAYSLEEADKLITDIARIEMQSWMSVFILSTIVNITLNSLMYQKIRELKWKRRLSMNSQETLNIRMKQEAFVTICLLLVTAIFLRLPFPIVSIVSLEVSTQKNKEIQGILQITVLILLYTNFFADPLIYIARMREAREFIRGSTSICVAHCSSRTEKPRTQGARTSLICDGAEKTDVTCLHEQRKLSPGASALSTQNGGNTGGRNQTVNEEMVLL